MGTRIACNNGRPVSLVAVGAGDGGAITNAVILHIKSTPSTGSKTAILRKIRWENRTGTSGRLLIGYADRTVGIALFRQVGIVYMVTGIADGLNEIDLPIMGNSLNGFATDVTLVTGSIGNIYVETDIAAVAAAPNNVLVWGEVEEIP